MKNSSGRPQGDGPKGAFEPETSLEESQSQLFMRSQENTDREVVVSDANPGRSGLISQDSRASLNSLQPKGGNNQGAEALEASDELPEAPS